MTTHRAPIPRAPNPRAPTSRAPTPRAPDPRTPTPCPPDWRPRSQRELAAAQLLAITRFHAARRAAERAAAGGTRSRELRMDSARTLEVLQREHAALVERSHAQLRLSGELLRADPARRRVVLAHRGAWFVDTVRRLLEDEGWRTVAQVDNGADAVGVVVAEQPDALLVEDTLAMLTGEHVVREVRALSPGTVVVAQVAHGERVAQLLAAGATTVVHRTVAPADVAGTLRALVPV